MIALVTSLMGLSDLSQACIQGDITMLLPLVANFVAILLQQPCLELLGQPCNKSNIPVKLSTSCWQLVPNLKYNFVETPRKFTWCFHKIIFSFDIHHIRRANMQGTCSKLVNGMLTDFPQVVRLVRVCRPLAVESP